LDNPLTGSQHLAARIAPAPVTDAFRDVHGAAVRQSTLRNSTSDYQTSPVTIHRRSSLAYPKRADILLIGEYLNDDG